MAREKRVFPSLLRLRTQRAVLGQCLLAAGLALAGCGRGSTPPPLECIIDYGGEAHTASVHPTTDPYRVTPLQIEDAFAFKAVYVAKPAPEAVIDFYVYYLTPRGPVIAEQTKYRPPFPRNAPTLNGNFTGTHHVYGPDGEELVYSCRWRSQ